MAVHQLVDDCHDRSFPWVNNLVGFYDAGELVGFKDFPRLQAALEAFRERPAVQAGLNMPG